MRFTVSAAALVAFASSVLAQTAGFDAITAPKKDEEVPAGSTFDIVWEPSAKYTGTVSLSLLGGDSPNTLVPSGTIKSGIKNSEGKFAWSVDSTLGKEKTYGIKITLDSDKSFFQYSFPFHIKGGYSGNSSTTTSASATYSASVTKSASTTLTYSTYVPSGNLSTTRYSTYAPTQFTLTSTVGGGSSPTKSSTPSTLPSSGAQSLAAGSLAMLGGLAAAVFAL